MSTRELALAALAELNAPEPNPSPAQLMGGPLAWGGSPVTMVEAKRDPVNAPTMRPHVIAPCQKLQSHPALRLHCSCGKALTFVALASLSTGVLVVSSPYRRPKKLRQGGPNDLATVSDPSRPWALIPWEASMRERASQHQTAWTPGSPHPALGPGAGVIGDTAKRQTFACGAARCNAVHTFLNVNLLRVLLKAIAVGEPTVRIRTTKHSSDLPPVDVGPDNVRTSEAHRALQSPGMGWHTPSPGPHQVAVFEVGNGAYELTCPCGEQTFTRLGEDHARSRALEHLDVNGQKDAEVLFLLLRRSTGDGSGNPTEVG